MEVWKVMLHPLGEGTASPQAGEPFAFTCGPSVLAWSLQRNSVVLPRFLCVGSTNSLCELVTCRESIEKALALSCGGDCQAGNDEAFDQCNSPSSSFLLIPPVCPPELGGPSEQGAEESFAVNGLGCFWGEFS